MTMTAGSVAIDGNGNRTGSGLALALYDAELPILESNAPDWIQQAMVDDPTITVAHRTVLADQCTARAGAIVATVTAARITIAADTWGTGDPSTTKTVDGAIS